MDNFGSKKGLEIALSRLLGFSSAKVSEEQYITPSSIAAEVIWKAKMSLDIDGKNVIDLGSGTGILGLGCLLVGAKRVYFIEKDPDAMNIAKANYEKLKSEGYDLSEAVFITKDIASVSKSDVGNENCVAIMNPPFGTKKKHADKEFLEKAMELSRKIYSFHKTSTMDFLVDFSSRKGFNSIEAFNFDYLLSNTMCHHTRQKKYIKVSCLVFLKNNN